MTSASRQEITVDELGARFLVEEADYGNDAGLGLSASPMDPIARRTAVIPAGRFAAHFRARAGSAPSGRLGASQNARGRAA